MHCSRQGALWRPGVVAVPTVTRKLLIICKFEYTLKPVIEEKESEEGNSMLALLLYPVVICVDFLVDEVYKVKKFKVWMNIHNFHLQSVFTSFLILLGT